MATSELGAKERTGGRRVPAGELTLFFAPLPWIPMCVNSACSERRSLSSPQLLPLPCTFLSLSLHRGGAFFLSACISLYLPWVCECTLLLLSVFPLLFLCLFVLVLVSLFLFLPLSACVCLFFSACLFQSFSVNLLSLLPTPYILLSLSLSPRLSRSPSLTPLLPAHGSLRLACPHHRRFRGTCAERLSWGTFDGLER